MNTRRGFFTRFGLAIGAIIAAPKMAFQKRQSKPFMYDPTKYVGTFEWRHMPVSPWLRLVQGGKFPEDQGLTKRSVCSKV